MGAPPPMPQSPMFGAPPPPAAGIAPPPMVLGAGNVLPPQPPGRAATFSPSMTGGAAGIAPPPMVSPPPMMSAGGVAQAVAPSGARVLVGFLVTFQNDPSGTFWPIYSGRTQLGRSSGDGVDIALADASASSRHASVHADPATGQAFVEDDGSRNGTFLNEQKLNPAERRQLRDNDRLRLGSTTFVVKLLVS
jgi:hypothetical protein